MGSKTGWKVQGTLVGSAVLLASMGVVAAPGGKPGKARSPAAATAGVAGLHVTVYETTLPAGRIADVDARALQAEAGTTTALKAALAKLGETKIAYHAYQLASLAGESRIQISSRRPFVTSTRMMGTRPRAMVEPRLPSSSRPPSVSRPPRDVRTTGRPRSASASRTPGDVRTTGRPRSASASRAPGISQISTVRYEDIGMILDLSVEPKRGEAKGVLHTRMSLELSALADSGVELAKDVKAPEVRRIQMKQVGEMRIGRPIVTIHVDGSSRGKNGSPTAYVCRVLLSEAP
jgi:hypothetical protein